MRKIDEDTANSWNQEIALTLSPNTKTVWENGILKLYLYDNLIAKKEDGITYISDAGWGSSVTARRLSAITNEKVSFSKGEYCFFRGWPIDGKWIQV
jgi:hypothetical protein